MSHHLLIEAHLKRLKLPAIARSYEAMAREAAAANQSFDGYLLALLEQEVRQRDENLQRKRCLESVLPSLSPLRYGSIRILIQILGARSIKWQIPRP